MNERHFITITLRCCCRRQRCYRGSLGEDVSLWRGLKSSMGPAPAQGVRGLGCSFKGLPRCCGTFRKVGSASPAAPRSFGALGRQSHLQLREALSFFWGMLRAPLHPIEGAGFGLNCRVISFFLLGFTIRRPPQINATFSTFS